MLLVALASCANVESTPLPGVAHAPNEGPRPTAPPPGSLDALLVATTNEWVSAHNEHDHKRLEALYATHVRFERVELSQEALLRLKEAEFTHSPSARHAATDVRIDRTRVGLPEVRFRTSYGARNRARTDETRLILSCDMRGVRDCEGVPCAKSEAPSCVVVAEESSAFLDARARGEALARREGSCIDAVVAFAASTKDAQKLLGQRLLHDAAVPFGMPPESARYGVLFLDEKGAPKALYELEPLTLDMTEVLPGDIPQIGDPAKKEHAKRACTPR